MLPRLLKSKIQLYALVLLGTLLMLGCSDDSKSYTFHPVKGHVVRKGKAVTGGTIQFTLPDDPNFIAQSPIAQDGSFNLQTTTTKPARTVDGAPEGKYQVSYRPPQEGTQTLPLTVAPNTYLVNSAENDLTIKLP